MLIRNLLCPVDFAPASLRSFDYSLKLAANYGASLHLLHVIAPVMPMAYDHLFDTTNLTEAIEKRARYELQRLSKKAANAGVETDGEVRIGDPRAEIGEYVKTHKVDLVAMGKHASDRFERWVMGSVTDQLLRHLPVPILIIGEGRGRKAAPPNLKRIVMTTDFSEGAADAIAYTLSLAEDAGATVTFFHVMPHTLPGVGVPYQEPLGEVNAELERLIPKKERMSGRIATKVKSGVPYEEILKFVNKTRPDLLVMNIHGKSLLERALLGSTAERVIRGALCPVLAIPPKKKVQRSAAARKTVRRKAA